ncbi:aminotransferase class IV [Flavobacteriaceae bacterium]|nr:aminotransferase class IV [Flavobacteriaceae bacterium]MDB9712962.1 aminotransferase class IV [Flavobacteriaceae bacterium]MDC1492293.1 aminotransferase class IV [Flavobacteriaceae bacterium]
MVNINGQIHPNDDAFISLFNTSLISGDFIFENIIVSNNRVLFFEQHYFSLLSSMRILKIKIPMSFTPEFLEKELLNLYIKSSFSIDNRLMRILISNNASVSVSSNSVKYYIYDVNQIDYFSINSEKYILDVFKDYFKNTGLLSNLTTNNQLIKRIGLRYCNENDFSDCIVLNNFKTISETLNGNIFMVMNNKVLTPPLKDGSNNNVIRSKVIDLINNDIDGFKVVEQSLSVFDIQKSDELFISNINFGIQPIRQFRKKTFGDEISLSIKNKLALLVMG